MKIYNTLNRKIEEFKPINSNEVKMYNCGPTVYYYPTIGNWRSYIFADTLKRALIYNGYKVKQVINITDVGHLTSDEDHGEDKIEKAAHTQNKTVWEIAEFYTQYFLDSFDKLNIITPDIICKATEHIPEQISMISKLIDKGYAYITTSAVYFDTSKLKNYPAFSNQKLEDKKIAVRDEVVKDENKKNPYDFRLWQLDDPNHQMLWDSPWGKGYPGWHIECSAMSTKYLGQPFDIHTGGVDHIGVHHPNEIAQAEMANDKKFVNYWLHNEFIVINGKKMSKSLGNGYILEDIEKFLKEHFSYKSNNFIIALRYLYHNTHYRKKLDFTKESLYASFIGLSNIYKEFGALNLIIKSKQIVKENNKNQNLWIDKLIINMNNDLDIPNVLADLHMLIKTWNPKSDIELLDKYNTILEYDKILGFNLLHNVENYIFNYSDEQKTLIEKRNSFRKIKDYINSDKLREQLELIGIDSEDGPQISVYYKK